MEVDILTHVFHPVEAGQPYLVMASAFAAAGHSKLKDLGRSVRTHCLEDAKAQCEALTAALREGVERAGWRVRSVAVKHG